MGISIKFGRLRSTLPSVNHHLQEWKPDSEEFLQLVKEEEGPTTRLSHLSQLERNFVVPQFGPGVLAKEDKWVKVTCLQGTIRVKSNFQRQDWSLVLSSSLRVIITVWHFVTLARSGVGATIPKADKESGFPEVTFWNHQKSWTYIHTCY